MSVLLPGGVPTPRSAAEICNGRKSEVGVGSMHNMKFLLLALKSGSADLLIE
jgi:hypothetical protein